MASFSKTTEALRKSSEYKNARKTKREHPKGWEPGIDVKGDKTTLTADPVPKGQEIDDWGPLLKQWNFDPKKFKVQKDEIQFRSWDMLTPNGKETMLYYRATIVRIDETSKVYDVKPLVDRISKHKAKPPAKNKGKDAFIVCLSDWQIGKQDGDGVEGTVDRVLKGIDDVTHRFKQLEKLGHTFDRIIIAGLGDLVEGCSQFYEMQTYSVEINQRDQINVGTNLLVKCIEAWSKLAPNIICVSLPGNHGENRKNGKAYTDFGDNYDLLIFDNAQRVFETNKKTYGHVNFLIPDKDLTMTLDVHGKILGMCHGHQFRAGGQGSAMKAQNWLKNQALAKTPIGDSDIFLSAHYHHLSVLHERSTSFIQAPALDGGSLWVENTQGLTTQPGVLTFCINSDGFHSLEVL